MRTRVRVRNVLGRSDDTPGERCYTVKYPGGALTQDNTREKKGIASWLRHGLAPGSRNPYGRFSPAGRRHISPAYWNGRVLLDYIKKDTCGGTRV